MNRKEHNDLVVENLPLVGYLVSEVFGRATHLSRDDLASAGAIALSSAVEYFDPTLGVPFGAYARKRIVGAFRDDSRSRDWATPHRPTETLLVQETLTGTLNRKPTVDEIASVMGINRESAVTALADARHRRPLPGDSSAEHFVAGIVLPEDSTLAAEKRRHLDALVDALPEMLRQLVIAIYFEDRTVGDLADELGTSHSAISQQRAEAIRHIRDESGSHRSDGAETEFLPKARAAPIRRNANLARVAETAAEFSRATNTAHE